MTNMKKRVLLAFLIVTFSNCRESKSDRRLEIVHKFLKAVKSSDTLELYSLIDTSTVFKVLAMENFLFDVNYAKKRFKECGEVIDRKEATIKELDNYSKNYILKFCRGKDGEKIYDSFDMIFTFSDFEERIQFFKVDKYRLNANSLITLPSN